MYPIAVPCSCTLYPVAVPCTRYSVPCLYNDTRLCQSVPTLQPAISPRLFKHNQFLLEQFLVLVPGVEPPDTWLPSPELLNYPEDSGDSCGSEELGVETLVLPRSPEH